MPDARVFLCPLLLCSCTGAPPSGEGAAGQPPSKPAASPAAAPSGEKRPPAFTATKVMVPARDGVKLETLVVAPAGAAKDLPFLFVRTPYGVPKDASPLESPVAAPLVADGYIFVWQNLRGRFESEGTFVMARPPRDKADPKAVDESTDAYDTIEWLLKNVPHNNGRVGMSGTSYDAWTATMALVDPHPALKAVVEEASPADQFIGDDFHHNGAFRLAYGFEYVALLESNKNENTTFSYGRGDLYDMFLDLGPLSNADARHFHGKMPTWNDFVEHPNRDAFWAKQSFEPYLRKSSVPVLNVSGWFDQEDFYGPFKIYDLFEKGGDAEGKNRLVVGPWNHGGWFGKGRRLGALDFESDTGEHYRREIKAPFLAKWLHDKAVPAQPEAAIFETGTNAWRSFDAWPPEAGVTKKRLYLRAGGALSFDPPTEAGAFDAYTSDPANPVPFCPRPIKPLFSSKQWPEWLSYDQRFVDHRPDVLSFSTGPLEADITVAGDVLAELYASTSGSDSDWVVKLIDVYPEGEAPPAPEHGEGGAKAEAPADMRGYQQMVASKVLRGRFRDGFDRPAPVPSGKAVKYAIDMQSHAHAFRKGHRIMVQVQSSWFPVIDRNPQKYVDNIFKAKPSDFIAATQKVSRSREAPSAVVLPVLSR